MAPTPMTPTPTGRFGTVGEGVVISGTSHDFGRPPIIADSTFSMFRPGTTASRGQTASGARSVTLENRRHVENRCLPTHPAAALFRSPHGGCTTRRAHGQTRPEHPGDDRRRQTVRDHGPP